MSAQIKGWCPSAHRPMMSGDGLLVRVRPRKARLSADAVHSLCDLALRFGNGMIDITSRANLQIRGVSEADHPTLLSALIDAGLVDANPAHETTMTVMPFWRADDLSDRLASMLEQTILPTLPPLPDKMGVVVDTGPARMLTQTSGDFRFETSDAGALILRADGAKKGWAIDEQDALSALSEMIAWFLKTGGGESGRMARHLNAAALPAAWQTAQPSPLSQQPEPGEAFGGHIIGVPFGQTDAAALKDLMTLSKASHLRVTPWRMLLLENAQAIDVDGFLNQYDPLLGAAACPGAPACSQASVATRGLARRLVPAVKGSLHVSGCAKGCASRARAEVTLVGRNGRFDLVQNGSPADTPVKEGLDEAEVLELFS